MRRERNQSCCRKREETVSNRSNQLGDDMKDEVRTDNDWYAWNY